MNTGKLEPGTTWKNQWTQKRCRVLEVAGQRVKVQFFDEPGQPEKDFPSLESFLSAYVFDC